MVMSFFALSFRPYLSILDAIRHIVSTYEKRLTWKRSVVRIHYSPPLKSVHIIGVFDNLVSLKPRPKRVEKAFYNTLQHF